MRRADAGDATLLPSARILADTVLARSGSPGQGALHDGARRDRTGTCSRCAGGARVGVAVTKSRETIGGTVRDTRPRLLPGVLRALGYVYFVVAGTCFCLALLFLLAGAALWVELREPGGLYRGARLVAVGLGGVVLGILAHVLEVRARRAGAARDLAGDARTAARGPTPRTEAFATTAPGVNAGSIAAPAPGASAGSDPETGSGARARLSRES